MNYRCIYKIINTITNKIYIGSTNDIYRRIQQHYYKLINGTHHSIKLQNSWNTYGPEFFTFEIIQPVFNESNLIEIEQMWLDSTRCYENGIGYNVSTCAAVAVVKGRKMTEEFKKLMSKLVKQRWADGVYNEETFKKIGDSNRNKYLYTTHPSKGIKRSKEHIEKSVKARKIKIDSGETVNYWKGKTLPDEVKKKIGIANSGKKRSPDHPFVTRNFKKPIIKHSEEVRLKMTLCNKRRIEVELIDSDSGLSRTFPSKKAANRFLKSIGHGCIRKKHFEIGEYKQYKIIIK